MRLDTAGFVLHLLLTNFFREGSLVEPINCLHVGHHQSWLRALCSQEAHPEARFEHLSRDYMGLDVGQGLELNCHGRQHDLQDKC